MTTKTNKRLKQNQSNNLGKLPIWDLGDLYNSSKDNKITSDLNFIKTAYKKFEKKYEGKIKKLNAESLFKAILELEKISEKGSRIISFAHLLHSEDLENEKNKIFFQNIDEKITEYASSAVFFGLEINAIKENQLQKILKNKKLKKFQTWIKHLRTFKPYQLSKELEKLLLDKDITSSDAWVGLFDDTIASLRFPFRKKKLSSAEILNLLSEKNPSKRKEAAKSLGKVLGQNVKLFATITNTLAKDKSIDDKWRQYPNPVKAMNLSNDVEDKVIETLSKTVTSSYSKLSHRYYAMKAKWFGVKRLKYWDRNAPLPFQSNKTFKWNEAKLIVQNAYSSFHPEVGKIATKFFDESWIHAPVIKGKSPGAFSASTVPNVHPYILVNYQGKIRDITTLAHELGHGIHQYLAGKKQGHFNSDTPLTLAETASVFGEMLTFQLMLKKENNQTEKKALLANKVEDMLNTVVRQISFFEFEKKIHTKRKNSELSVKEICSIWMETQKKSLGPSISFDDEYKFFWTYIPHFIHSPFYVYAYAFGDCLVNSLYAVYQDGLEKFDEKYIQLLEAGGSMRYRDLLKPFKLNPSNSDFWYRGISVIESFIDQLDEIK